MAKLTMRTLVRNNLPYGRFKYLVLIKRSSNAVWAARANTSEMELMRAMLRTTCVGGFRLKHDVNTRGKRVYTHLYLTNPMDLAMIKLVHADKLYKIYQIKAAEPSQP